MRNFSPWSRPSTTARMRGSTCSRALWLWATMSGTSSALMKRMRGLSKSGRYMKLTTSGTERDLGAELGHDEDGIDVAGMVGQDEGRAADLAQAVEAVDLDAIAQPGERAGEVAEEEVDEHRAVGEGLNQAGRDLNFEIKPITHPTIRRITPANPTAKVPSHIRITQSSLYFAAICTSGLCRRRKIEMAEQKNATAPAERNILANFFIFDPI